MAPSAEPASDPTLEQLRQQIDQTDNQLHDLLMERARCVLQVGHLKDRTPDAIYYRPEREARIHRRLEARHQGDLPLASLHRIFREIISASLNLEKKLSVAYLGPEATFTHQAALKQFGSSSNMQPLRSIAEVFHEVEVRRADFGVTPVENSAEGVVNHTLDCFIDSPLQIWGEIYLPVTHNLLSREIDIQQVQVIYGQHHALRQCRNWLSQHLPRVQIEEMTSTAEATSLMREKPHSAAIAGVYAADQYGLTVLAEHIEDQANNENRFLVIGHKGLARSGQDKTSLIISFRDQPGFLHRVLGVFAQQKVNLTLIESHPSRKKAWDYLFFVDFEGHQADPPVAAAIKELADLPGIAFKTLGSYPRRVL